MNEVKEVYRYEHPETRMGPYHDYASDVCSDLRTSHDADRVYHPGPWDDFGFFPSGVELFGCPTREHLEDWFYGFNGDLEMEGYVVVLYVVPDYDYELSKSGFQVMFNPTYGLREVLSW